MQYQQKNSCGPDQFMESPVTMTGITGHNHAQSAVTLVRNNQTGKQAKFFGANPRYLFLESAPWVRVLGACRTLGIVAKI